METRDDRRYTEEHEWVKVEDGNARIGISDYAQDQLGDVVYVELPEPGATYAVGDTMAEVESTKSVGEVYSPVAGTVVEVNTALAESPELINTAPYDDGWIVLIAVEDAAGLDDLIEPAAYAEMIG